MLPHLNLSHEISVCCLSDLSCGKKWDCSSLPPAIFLLCCAEVGMCDCYLLMLTHWLHISLFTHSCLLTYDSTHHLLTRAHPPASQLAVCLLMPTRWPLSSALSLLCLFTGSWAYCSITRTDSLAHQLSIRSWWAQWTGPKVSSLTGLSPPCYAYQPYESKRAGMNEGSSKVFILSESY